jgi:hypothetical protein
LAARVAGFDFNFYLGDSNNRMKRLILSAIFLPFAGKAGFDSAHLPSTNQVEIRSGEWPMNLERTIDYRDTSYALLFRDEQVLNGVSMDTLSFPDLEQLKYLGKALAALKTGTNGDIAKFKNYSIQRADKKNEGTWYILRDKWGLTSFQQPEADIMTHAIRTW